MHKNRLSNNSGAVLVIVALFTVALLAVTGLAIDSGIGFGVRAKLNAALDSAAIAAARAVATGSTDSERAAAAQAAGEKYFAANFPDGWLGATPGAPIISAVHHADGYWEIDASGSALVPTSFMRLMGRDIMTVNAAAEAIRRDLDMMLVIDSSGSMGNPSSAFGEVKDAASNFVDLFNSGPGGDRLGLVSFASGSVLDVPINKDSTRGFDKTEMQNAISALSASGYTTSEWAMQRAYQELEAVPAGIRSSLRVIVFFSDGAPNTVASDYTRFGSTVTGTLASGTSGPGDNRAQGFYDHLQLNSYSGSWGTDIATLPEFGLGNVPLASFNNARTLDPTSAPYDNTRCNVNMAARNMVENVANTARGNNIFVFTLGFDGSSRLSTQEIDFCGYGSEELGANILQRLANTTAADVSQGDQPRGLSIIFEEPEEAEAAFNQVASAILRLTR
ncbi:hypothetical protein A7E78_13120 [Syntrophotalea acetylenivorans]|uniref:VWFA domain-containing protein n=1 Tax=Syntrophotalea acetylenivorans TaxID=1842532 RepID=A0A1L3GS50_9BACT|nr:VWA domain-containing protein [Syntrophotalea acetylenivorans]APG28690.1 hypothetical protein A7E78_13120 [Syntrophotalea acetylenivorans]